MPNPSQEPPASAKARNEDLKIMYVLCNQKINMESQNLDYGCIKYQRPYPNQDQDTKLQSGTCSVLKRFKSALEGHGSSFGTSEQTSTECFQKMSKKHLDISLC